MSNKNNNPPERIGPRVDSIRVKFAKSATAEQKRKAMAWLRKNSTADIKEGSTR